MVNYWICIANEENWEVVRKQKVWGVPRRNRNILGRVKLGDILTFYVKPKRLVGIFKVVSEPFESDKKIFSPAGFTEGETFRHRVKLDPIVVLKEPLIFDELVEKLKFITNKKFWRGHLWGIAMRMIPKEDYDIIRKAMI